MLDKSLVYKDIVMCLPFEELKTLKVPVLPDGYSYKMFEPGDEVAWANLEVLVGEFDCFEDASAYFSKTFLAHEELLADRVCFIVNPEGEIVATTSAWFKTDGDVRFPLIHWVSASPNEQGKGLGRAIVLFALSRFLVVEPDADFVFLHTHTWAYKAVGMYQKMGFRITKKALPTSRTDVSCRDVTLIRFIGYGIFSIAVLGIFLYSSTLLYSSLNGSMICVLPMICIPASSPKP